MPPSPQALVYVYLLLLLSVPDSGAAGRAHPEPFPPYVPVGSFLQDAGLVRCRIFNLAFERNGTTWVAAANGLYRYDGYRWERFSQEDHGLPSSFVRAVTVTRDQTVWVGTESGAGVFEKRPEGWRFRAAAPPEKMAGPSVRRIMEDPDGTLWFCHDAWPDPRVPVGLSSLRNGVWQCFGKDEGIARPVLSYFRSATGEQFAVTLWNEKQILRRSGDRWIAVSDAEGFAWTMAETPEWGIVTQIRKSLRFFKDGRWSHAELPEEYPYHVLTSRRGELLACRPQGAYSVVLARWTGTAFEPISPPIPTNGAWLDEVVEAPDGAIWLCGDDALFRWDRDGSEWIRFPGLPWPETVDGRGCVWFAGDGKVATSEGGQLLAQAPASGRVTAAGRDHAWVWNASEATLLQSGNPVPKARLGASAVGLSQFLGAVGFGDDAALFFDHAAATRWTPQGQTRRQVSGELGYIVPPGNRHENDGVLLLSSRSTMRLASVDGQLSSPVAGVHLSGVLSERNGGFVAYGIGGIRRLSGWDSPDWTELPGLRGRNIVNALSGNAGTWVVFDGATGGASGIALWDGREWQQVLVPVNGSLARGADGSVVAGGPNCVYVAPGEHPQQIHRLTLPGDGQPRRLAVDAGGDLWVGLIDPTGETATYRYRRDTVPPLVRVRSNPGEVSSGQPILVAVGAAERFRPQADSGRFQYSWREYGGPWSEFAEAAGGNLVIAELEAGTHQIEVRSRDEGLDVSPTVALATITVLPNPIQMRRWFRPTVIGIGATLGLLAMTAGAAARRYRGANRHLKAEIRTRQETQRELSKLNAELERRVEERTAQMEEQITARRDEAVRFRAVLDERNRLGRELHDGVQQNLFSLAMQIEAVDGAVEDPRARNLLSTARDLLRQSLGELRRSVNDLRSELLENFDLVAALQVMCRQMGADHPARLSVKSRGTPRRFDATTENALFRIAQEGVANALKHSAAGHIVVELAFAPTAFSLEICDNGKGFEPARAPGPDDGHYGVLGMRERAVRIGAELIIESTSTGTTLRVVLPSHQFSPAHG